VELPFQGNLAPLARAGDLRHPIMPMESWKQSGSYGATASMESLESELSVLPILLLAAFLVIPPVIVVIISY